MVSNSNKNGFKAPFSIFIGPQRAGTSWMHRYFNLREDICLPKQVKELFYFDYNFSNGPEYYFSHFKEEPCHKLVMEVSATYFFHPEAPKRIYEYFGPNIKLVCPLRHPVSRSYSLYQHFCRYGLTQGDLQEACEKTSEILTSSHYLTHLKNWTEYFDLENIYICFQEDLDNNQSKFLEGLCAYLEIPFKKVPAEAQNRTNVTTKPPVQFIANIAQVTATSLRSMKLYWIINFAKSIGLKKLIFGIDEKEKQSENEIPEEDRRYLEKKLLNQVDLLEDFLGYKIKVWHEDK